MLFSRLLLAMLALAAAANSRTVVVLSIDGLDQRYLREADRLGLKIPSMRRLLREGAWARGVVGVFPSITWPSHTTIVTGVRPDEHGILANWRPVAGKADLYLSARDIRTPTLWDRAHAAGLRTASITWPSTVEAPIDWNLPEYFQKRNGGGMDLASIEAKATPGLVARIAAAYPSFPTEWMDDRTRTLAALYLLKAEKPDLLLIHFVDLDAEAHETGPFSRAANATLEHLDELTGQLLAALPPDAAFVLTSDHGFERVDTVVNLPAVLKARGTEGKLSSLGGVAFTSDPKVAQAIRAMQNDPQSGVGREVPRDEVLRYAPQLAANTLFESAEHFEYGEAPGEPFSKPREIGSHGYWPTRAGYRSVFLVRSAGVAAGERPEMQMTEIEGRLEELLGLAGVQRKGIH